MSVYTIIEVVGWALKQLDNFFKMSFYFSMLFTVNIVVARNQSNVRTVQCHYNAVNFIQSVAKDTP